MFLLLAAAQLLKENYIVPTKINNEQVGFVIDANWRWIQKNGVNCYDGSWKCDKCDDCLLEGVPKSDYDAPYGVKSDGNSISLSYVTVGPYSTNVGSRLYMVKDSDYYNFNLEGATFSFNVDLSQVPCGVNAAVYFVQMRPIAKHGGALFGTGYNDAQCPKDIKFVDGFVNKNNTGVCGRELDILESNRHAQAFTIHNCKTQSNCYNNNDCGDGKYRYKSLCDKDGGDYNRYRLGSMSDFGYGPQFKINTQKAFSVATTFSKNEIKQVLKQGNNVVESILNDKIIENNKNKFGENNYHAKLGGMSKFDLKNLNLVISLWDDSATEMKWLDSTFPVNSNQPGALRGPCTENTNPSVLRQKYANAKVVFSDFKFSTTQSVIFNCASVQVTCLS